MHPNSHVLLQFSAFKFLSICMKKTNNNNIGQFGSCNYHLSSHPKTCGSKYFWSPHPCIAPEIRLWVISHLGLANGMQVVDSILSLWWLGEREPTIHIAKIASLWNTCGNQQHTHFASCELNLGKKLCS